MVSKILKVLDGPTQQTNITTAIDNKQVNSSTSSQKREREQFLGLTNPTPELTTYGGIKLGWIQGVLIPCLLNIWGVMLFLRIAWIVAQAGIGLTLVIISLSAVVCVITTLSMSAICTNGELQGGGIYYLLSRSLGAELGASVGIIFAFANAVAASMNTIGFCDSLNELLKSNGLKIIDNAENDTRIIGAIALFVMCLICAIGMDWETKTQNFLITVIVLAIANYMIGSFIGPKTKEQIAKGFVGLNEHTIKDNWHPDFRFSEGKNHNFFSVFAMYFPAVTGVQAGANICGDLRLITSICTGQNPAKAIPKGTLLAVAISTTSYLWMAVLSGAGALRDASGISTNLTHQVLASCKPKCEYGLHNNYEIMQLMALWGPLIYGGCWAATLSTALTNLLSVPRLIQALGIDRIYPGLIFFSKPYGKHGEPYRGYVLTFLVSLLFLLIADLNTIAPLITNFYLASYSLINFCTFHASFVQHHSWRPTYKCYNTWLSLLGFFLCIVIMMIISWIMALITMLIFFVLYFLVLYRKPDANWGSSTEAQRYQDIVSSLLEMSYRPENIKSYNPQLLVLAGRANTRPALLDIGHLITKVGSFMIVADISTKILTYLERVTRRRVGNEWLSSRKNRGFYVILDGHNFESGVRSLVQVAGLGRLAPNILFLGYKYNWTSVPSEEVNTYVRVLQYSFELKIAVAILRVPDWARARKHRTPSRVTLSIGSDSSNPRMHSQVLNVLNADSEPESEAEIEPEDGKKQEDIHVDTVNENRKTNNILRQSSVSSVFLRDTNYKPLSFNNGDNLDVWWLYDDGGLNILISYIICNRGNKHMNLRIFALAKECYAVENAKKCMESLLAKFRIQYTSLTMVHGVDDPPSDDSLRLLQSLKDTINSDMEAPSLRLKTNRQLRLRELLLEHSANAALIVMTLPLPRQGRGSAALYMAWLEVLSRDLPPMLLVRGNETSVLTAEA